jgi:predicted CopG family antitoxin
MKKDSNKPVIQIDREVHRQLLITKSVKGYKNISDVIKAYVEGTESGNGLS